MKVVFTIVFQCLLLAVAAQTSTLSKSSYSIKYPSTWSIDASSDEKQFTITAPPDSAIVDRYVENLNMVINQLNSPYTAEQYANFSKSYLPQKIKQFTVLESKKGNTPGKDSWYMVFKGVQSGKKVQWKQYYIIHKGNVHILTFSGEAVRYKNYSKVVNAMIGSYVAK